MSTFATVVDAFTMAHAVPNPCLQSFALSMEDIGLKLYVKPLESKTATLAAPALLVATKNIAAKTLCLVPSARDLSVVSVNEFDQVCRNGKHCARICLLDGAKHTKALDGYACISLCKKRDVMALGFLLMACAPDVNNIPGVLTGSTPALTHVAWTIEHAGQSWKVSCLRNKDEIKANTVLTCEWKDTTPNRLFE